jgi:hypothetical protein
LLLVFGVACGSASVPAPSPPPPPTGAAGITPAAERFAWHPFTSRESGFSVSLPGPVAVQPCDASGGDCRVFAVRFGVGPGFFVRTWSAPSVVAEGVEAAFDRLRDGWMAAGKEKLVSDRSSTMAGQPCRVFEGTGESPAGTWRIQGRILFDAAHRRVFELSVETPPADPAQEDAATFFDSFRVLE